MTMILGDAALELVNEFSPGPYPSTLTFDQIRLNIGVGDSIHGVPARFEFLKDGKVMAYSQDVDVSGGNRIITLGGITGEFSINVGIVKK